MSSDKDRQKVIARLIDNAIKAGNRPTMKVNGPMSFMVRKQAKGALEEHNWAFTGQEKVTPTSVLYDTDSTFKQSVSVIFTPQDISVTSKSVRFVVVPFDRAVEEIDGFADFMEKIISEAEGEALVQVKQATAEVANRRQIEEQERRDMEQSEAWGAW